MILDQLTDTQRKLVFFGVPAVVGLFIVTRLTGGGGGAPAEPAPPDADLPVGAVGPYAMPSTDAIGTGALSDFLSQLTDQYNEIQQSLTADDGGDDDMADFLAQLTDQYNSIQRTLLDRPQGVSPTPRPARRTDGQVISSGDLDAMYRRRISVNDPRISQGVRRGYVRYLLARGARPA